MAAIGGTSLALFLLAVFVAPVGLGLPVASFVIALLLFAGAVAMARQANTPSFLPIGIFVPVSAGFFTLLWSSFVAERVVSRHSLDRRAQVIRELRQMQLQHRTEPASTPMPQFGHRPRTTVG